jgi:hypothetical protein
MDNYGLTAKNNQRKRAPTPPSSHLASILPTETKQDDGQQERVSVRLSAERLRIHEHCTSFCPVMDVVD